MTTKTGFPAVMDTSVLRAKHILPTYLMRGQVPISAERLAELERKELAHSSYLEAAQRMGLRQVQMTEATGDYADGWRAALREFSEFVVEQARR